MKVFLLTVILARFSRSMEMSRLTRDGTAEPISRDQILRHAREQGNIIFPVQLTTSRIGNLARLIHTPLYVMTIHTYIHTSNYNISWKGQNESKYLDGSIVPYQQRLEFRESVEQNMKARRGL